jgi:hypothetical protein
MPEKANAAGSRAPAAFTFQGFFSSFLPYTLSADVCLFSNHSTATYVKSSTVAVAALRLTEQEFQRAMNLRRCVEG